MTKSHLLAGASIVSALLFSSATAFGATISPGQYGTTYSGTPTLYSLWVDTSLSPNNVIKVYDGSQWLVSGYLNVTDHTNFISRNFASTDTLVQQFFLGSSSPALGVSAYGPVNPIMGFVVQNSTTVSSLPSGVAGLGRNIVSTGGNTVFGIWGRADLGRAPPDTPIQISGSAVNEFDAFNWSKPPPYLPGSPGFGTSDAFPVSVIAACGGTYQCLSALYIVPEGSAHRSSFHNGIYAYPGAVIGQYSTGMLIDALVDDTSGNKRGPETSAILRNTGVSNNTHLILQTVGSAAVDNPVVKHLNASGTQTWSITQGGAALLNSMTSTAQYPRVRWIANTNATDAKSWDQIVDGGGTLHFRAVKDDDSTATDWLLVGRTGTTVTAIQLLVDSVTSKDPVLRRSSQNLEYLTPAGSGVGSLGGAPASGNPTRWLKINDNGTLRYIPAW